jgi:hypothetical protein
MIRRSLSRLLSCRLVACIGLLVGISEPAFSQFAGPRVPPVAGPRVAPQHPRTGHPNTSEITTIQGFNPRQHPPLQGQPGGRPFAPPQVMPPQAAQPQRMLPPWMEKPPQFVPPNQATPPQFQPPQFGRPPQFITPPPQVAMPLLQRVHPPGQPVSVGEPPRPVQQPSWILPQMAEVTYGQPATTMVSGFGPPPTQWAGGAQPVGTAPPPAGMPEPTTQVVYRNEPPTTQPAWSMQEGQPKNFTPPPSTSISASNVVPLLTINPPNNLAWTSPSEGGWTYISPAITGLPTPSKPGSKIVTSSRDLPANRAKSPSTITIKDLRGLSLSDDGGSSNDDYTIGGAVTFYTTPSKASDDAASPDSTATGTDAASVWAGSTPYPNPKPAENTAKNSTDQDLSSNKKPFEDKPARPSVSSPKVGTTSTQSRDKTPLGNTASSPTKASNNASSAGKKTRMAKFP